MNADTQKNSHLRRRHIAIIFICALLTNFSIFAWQLHIGFSLWDEGFLWYGVQRVMLGEVPIRDFMAYDPGRYYWSAALMSTAGDSGILSLRTAVFVFQTFGLFSGLLLISQSMGRKGIEQFAFLALSTVILLAWMFPRHKLFDISLSILLIGTLAYLVHNPVRSRYFFAGLGVGLVAIFGRNHGIYGAAGSVGVMIWLNIKQSKGPRLSEGFAIWAGGVVVGYAPILLMTWQIQGFAVAFWDSILFLFEAKATNLPLPVPWPWLVSFNSVPLDEAIRSLLVGLFFVATIAFCLLTIMWVVRQRIQDKQVQPPLVAAAFLALPYAHYAFSRADVGHLAQGIFPPLIGCLVLLATQPVRVKWPLALLLCSTSLWISHTFHPVWQCQTGKQCLHLEISHTTLQVDSATAGDIELLRALSNRFAPDVQSFIVTPFWPGAYAMLGRKSPMWEIYALFPRSPAFELAEIERIRIANPQFCFVIDMPLDGRDELRFKNTHPLIHQYILDNFELLPSSPNPAYQIYIAKSGSQ